MKIFKSGIYILIAIVTLIGMVKILTIYNDKISIGVGESGETYFKTESSSQYRIGDGEYQREKQQKKMITLALTYGGLIIGLLLLTTALKNKQNSNNSKLITGSNFEKSKTETSSPQIFSQNEKSKNNPMEYGIQYQKLAETANGCYLLLRDIKNEITIGNKKPDHLFYTCYLVRTDILDRIEKFKWNLNTPIVVPMIPGDNKTLEVVLNILIQKINTYAENISHYEECQEILRKEDFFYDLESRIPSNARSNF